MARSTLRTTIVRSAIVWHSVVTIIIVALYLYFVGDKGLVGLVMILIAVGLITNRFHLRFLERSVTQPLEHIAEVTQAIAEGATSGRIEMSAHAVSETVRVAEGINKLAQKASGDIAEMKRLEQVRSEFVGNVSHELRTPIFSVQGYLETLLDGAMDDPEVRGEFLDKAYRNALRLNTLLNDLIEISKIESGELQFSFRYFDIGPMLKEIAQNAEMTAQAKEIKLIVDLPEGGEVMVYGDKERLTQVITNLVDNAIKYNTPQGTVTIEAEPVGHKVEVSVADTGIGIAAADQPRLFERFYRVDSDRSRAVGGTGLGLAIVKHILEAHKAPYKIQSEPGKGTRVSFELRTEN